MLVYVAVDDNLTWTLLAFLTCIIFNKIENKNNIWTLPNVLIVQRSIKICMAWSKGQSDSLENPAAQMWIIVRGPAFWWWRTGVGGSLRGSPAPLKLFLLRPMEKETLLIRLGEEHFLFFSANRKKT